MFCSKWGLAGQQEPKLINWRTKKEKAVSLGMIAIMGKMKSSKRDKVLDRR